jgi:hypothetical protein
MSMFNQPSKRFKHFSLITFYEKKNLTISQVLTDKLKRRSIQLKICHIWMVFIIL